MSRHYKFNEFISQKWLFSKKILPKLQYCCFMFHKLWPIHIPIISIELCLRPRGPSTKDGSKRKIGKLSLEADGGGPYTLWTDLEPFIAVHFTSAGPSPFSRNSPTLLRIESNRLTGLFKSTSDRRHFRTRVFVKIIAEIRLRKL